MSRLEADTLEALLSTVRDYGNRELRPHFLQELDARDEFPRGVLADLNDPSRLGLHLLSIPEVYGGLGGSAYDVYRLCESMAAIDLGIATGVLATFLGTDPIRVGGTPEQKEKWLGRLAREGFLVAYAATEPQAGSDLAALATRAVPDHADGRLRGYRLTGRKQWISNGGVASVYSVLALAPGGPSWFIVEQGDPGFTTGKPEQKHGIRASNTAALFLDDVFVPAENLVGGVEGKGLTQAQAVFGYTRLMVAAFGLGAGWSALQKAIRYAQERVQGGAPLSQKQAYTHKLLVPHAARLEAARAYVEWTADRLDAGEGELGTEGAVAKYFATEAANHAAEDAIQALGGYGYTRDYQVEKIKRDVRITTIYEGTSEIMEWTIARDRWQSHLKSRGRHYLDWADRLAASHAGPPETGAATAAQALRALAATFERARLDRLTRSQHVLFRLGELAAWAETAAVFADRAATRPTAAIALPAPLMEALARIHAREAALRVATDGLRWLLGAGANDPHLSATLDLAGALSAQAGLIADMDFAAAELPRAFPV
jgi:alkylation response protein AidB-like acyl-CoA dehydrogenase